MKFVDDFGFVHEIESSMKTMTNADRIRSMTDEELAEHHRNRGCPPNKRCPDGTELRDIRINDVCTKCWLDWLKEEAVSDGRFCE